MVAFTTETSAQGWLNKALKKVEDVTKIVDGAVNSLDGSPAEETEKQTATSNNIGATIKCSNKNLNIQFESCIRDGKLTVLSYYVTNNGNDLKLNYIGRTNVVSGQTATSFYDNEGKQYKWTDITFGEERYNGTEWLAPVVLPQGVKIKCTVVLANVSKTAKQLNRATVTGWDFVLQFNNVPIYTVDQTLAKDNVILKKENPVGGLAEKAHKETYTIESVTITENNTQIRVLVQAPQINNIQITPGYNPDIELKADGKSYALLNAFGVSKHWLYTQYYTLEAGQSGYIDLVFEKIPETTQTISIQSEDLLWKSVWLVDPPKPGA
ncbi:hypothetical protein D0T60_09010 [Bacteroides sp. 224]|nr:hypothetical protein [Bacteroides sp. 224]